MKKNKTIAYMLAATLLVGGTFVGTKAWFTDEATVAGELKISTGDLDIEVVDKGTWDLVRAGEEYRDGTYGVNDPSNLGGTLRIEEDKEGQTNEEVPEGAFANNLKPGDKLTKTVTIQNKGTLIANDITLNRISKNELYGGLFKVTTSELGKNVLNPGEKTTFTIELEVNNVGGQHGDKNGFNTDTLENTIIDLDKDILKGESWELKAIQQH